MCGIAGLVEYLNPRPDQAELITKMTDALFRRGPDDSRVWVADYVALGTRRLSVIDPHGGVQPMVDEVSGRPPVALAYTGEIFNCDELRAELRIRGHSFATGSDTEVVLRAYLEWGEGCADRLLGMFAFAVWDGRTEDLVIIRDRFGIYPIYYAQTTGGLVFGSELKALLAHPEIRAEIDLDGLRELVTFIKPPESGIYRGVSEVVPGTVVRLSRSGVRTDRYWSLTAREHTDDLDTTIATVRELLEDSVRRQIVSDVPVGYFLSGGLDSSSIVALAAHIGGDDAVGQVRTYSVAFDGQFVADSVHTTADEPFVQRMAKHLGTQHTTVTLSGSSLMDAQARRTVMRARDLPSPLGDLDTSLYLLCKAFRRDCTVAVLGDGADELLGGYPWFHESALHASKKLPWMEYARLKLNYPQMQYGELLDPILVSKFDAENYEREIYRKVAGEVSVLDSDSQQDLDGRRMTYLNLTGYLRIILDRKDRNGMAASMESRVPFLDHRLVEYVYNVPWELKNFDRREKSLLRAAVRDLLPPSVLYRKKAGFPPTQDPAYGAMLRAELMQVAADKEAPVHSLLNLRAIQRHLDDGTDLIGDHVVRASAEMVLQLNTWLDDYQVRLLL